MLKRFFTLLLVVVMVFGMMPQMVSNADSPPQRAVTVKVYQNDPGDSDTADTKYYDASDLVNMLNSTSGITTDYKYELMEDITISSDDLLFSRAYSATSTKLAKPFQGDFEGNGNTLKIEVPDGEIARPLFQTIGENEQTDQNYLYKPYYFTNINIEFTGHVSTAPLFMWQANNVTFDDVNVKVDGDIVTGPHPLWTGQDFANASGGIAAGLGFEMNRSIVSNCIIDVTGNIGHNDDFVAKMFGSSNYNGTMNSRTAVGFTTKVKYSTLSGITIKAGSIVNKTPGTSSITSGFVRDTVECKQVDDIQISVANDLGTYKTESTTPIMTFGNQSHTIGFGSTQLLTNSKLTVGNDMFWRCLNTTPVNTTSEQSALIGIAAPLNAKISAPSGMEGNTLNIKGNMEVKGNVTLIAAAGFFPFSVGPVGVPTKGNTVHIEKDFISADLGNSTSVLGNLVYGMHGVSGTQPNVYRYESSRDDTFKVDGNVEVKSKKIPSQFKFGNINAPVENYKCEIGGSVISESEENAATIYGIDNQNEKVTASGIRVKIDENVKLSGKTGTNLGGLIGRRTPYLKNSSLNIGGNVISETENGSSTVTLGTQGDIIDHKNNSVYLAGDIESESSGDATIDVAGYIDAPENASAQSTSIDDITAHINGDIKVRGNDEISVAGMLTEISSSCTMTDSLAYIKGKVDAHTTGDASAAGYFDVGGFAVNNKGTLKNNAAFVAGGITASAISGDPTIGPFICRAEAGSATNENTLMGRAGHSHNNKDYFKSFASEVDGSADVEGNYYTAVMKDQRVSDKLEYNTTDSEFKVDASESPDRFKVSNGAMYHLESDTCNSTLKLNGCTAGGIVYDKVSGCLDVTGPSDSFTPYLPMIVREGKPEVLDVYGLGPVYENNKVQGTIYRDDNNTGDQSKPLNNVTVNLKYGNKIVDTGKTDGQGKYEIDVPLLKCIPVDVDIEVIAPSGYKHGTVAANSFAYNGVTTSSIGYVNHHTFDGYLVSADNGGGSNPSLTGDKFKLTYDGNESTGGKAPAPVEVESGKKVVVEKQGTLEKEGYKFSSWNTKTDGSGIKYMPGDKIRVEQNTTLYAQWANENTHDWYIQGFPDGTVGPDLDISRAEVAVILHRLSDDPNRDNVHLASFPDTEDPNEWYYDAVRYLVDEGVLHGYPDGNFYPGKKISRSEFIKMVTLFWELELDGTTNPFNDITSDHWAWQYILSGAKANWIEGYLDGSFKPNDPIDRAETVTIINRIIDRSMKKNDIPESYWNHYPDLKQSHWAFGDILEASIRHDYTKEDGQKEVWTTSR